MLIQSVEQALSHRRLDLIVVTCADSLLTCKPGTRAEVLSLRALQPDLALQFLHVVVLLDTRQTALTDVRPRVHGRTAHHAETGGEHSLPRCVGEVQPEKTTALFGRSGASVTRRYGRVGGERSAGIRGGGQAALLTARLAETLRRCRGADRLRGRSGHHASFARTILDERDGLPDFGARPRIGKIDRIVYADAERFGNHSAVRRWVVAFFAAGSPSRSDLQRRVDAFASVPRKVVVKRRHACLRRGELSETPVSADVTRQALRPGVVF